MFICSVYMSSLQSFSGFQLFSIIWLFLFVPLYSAFFSCSVILFVLLFEVNLLFLVVRLFPIGCGGARGGSRRRGRGQHLHRLQATARGRSCRYAGSTFLFMVHILQLYFGETGFKLLIYSVLQRNVSYLIYLR